MVEYIDDIFLLWEHGENKLKSFINKINKVHPTIKFTAAKVVKNFYQFFRCHCVSCRRSNRN